MKGRWGGALCHGASGPWAAGRVLQAVVGGSGGGGAAERPAELPVQLPPHLLVCGAAADRLHVLRPLLGQGGALGGGCGVGWGERWGGAGQLAVASRRPLHQLCAACRACRRSWWHAVRASRGCLAPCSSSAPVHATHDALQCRSALLALDGRHLSTLQPGPMHAAHRMPPMVHRKLAPPPPLLAVGAQHAVDGGARPRPRPQLRPARGGGGAEAGVLPHAPAGRERRDAGIGQGSPPWLPPCAPPAAPINGWEQRAAPRRSRPGSPTPSPTCTSG